MNKVLTLIPEKRALKSPIFGLSDYYGQIDVEKMAKDATKKVSYDKDGNCSN